jgi:hypothetical protein
LSFIYFTAVAPDEARHCDIEFKFLTPTIRCVIFNISKGDRDFRKRIPSSAYQFTPGDYPPIMSEARDASLNAPAAGGTTMAHSTTSISESEKERETEAWLREKEKPSELETSHPVIQGDNTILPSGASLTKAETARSQPGGAPLGEIQTREDGTEYPSSVKLIIIVTSLCLSVFLMALGTVPAKLLSLNTPWYQS